MSEGVVLYEVRVRLVLTDLDGDQAQLVTVETEGAPPAVMAIGMLRMAEDLVCVEDDS